MNPNQAMRPLGWPMLLVAVIICVIASQANAALGDWAQEAKLLPSDGAAEGLFGCSVSISGDTAVIGAWGDDDNGGYSGSAYVFRYDGTNWVEEAKLLPSDGATYDYFGISVSVSSDTAVIGAYRDDDNGSESGSAYVFRHEGTGWVEEVKLLASDGDDGDRFGYSVSISGDTVVIGADYDDDHGESSGSAYVFRYDGTGWVEDAKLLPSDGAADDYFGISVSISGDTAVIGAYRDDDNGSDSGSVYVFRYNGAEWTQKTKLLASDGDADDLFGYPVSIFGDAVIIGAMGNDDNGSNSGSAYVFRDNSAGWVQEGKLLPSDGDDGDSFGHSVSISGSTAVIGAFWDDDNGGQSGSAYVFLHDGAGWVEDAKLLPSDGDADDLFGCSVSVSGNTAVIGARGDDDNGDSSGAAYIFAQCPADFDGDGDVDTIDLLTLLAAWGDCPMECPWDFNGDSYVDDLDREILMEHWGDCPDPPEECPWDLNGDGVVDGRDLMELIGHYGPCPLDECPTDLDGDRDTNTADLLALLAAWGECP